MNKLIEKGMLKVGQRLYNKTKKVSAKILVDGHLNDGKEKLSIHRMSAKYLNKENNNGWDFWYVLKNRELKCIDKLRYDYVKKFGYS